MNDYVFKVLKRAGVKETPLASLDYEHQIFVLTSQYLIFQLAQTSPQYKVVLRDITRIHSDQAGTLAIETGGYTPITTSLVGYEPRRVQQFFQTVRDTTASAKQLALSATFNAFNEGTTLSAPSSSPRLPGLLSEAATPAPVVASAPKTEPIEPQPSTITTDTAQVESKQADIKPVEPQQTGPTAKEQASLTQNPEVKPDILPDGASVSAKTPQDAPSTETQAVTAEKAQDIAVSTEKHIKTNDYKPETKTVLMAEPVAVEPPLAVAMPDTETKEPAPVVPLNVLSAPEPVETTAEITTKSESLLAAPPTPTQPATSSIWAASYQPPQPLAEPIPSAATPSVATLAATPQEPEHTPEAVTDTISVIKQRANPNYAPVAAPAPATTEAPAVAATQATSKAPLPAALSTELLRRAEVVGGLSSTVRLLALVLALGGLGMGYVLWHKHTQMAALWTVTIAMVTAIALLVLAEMLLFLAALGKATAHIEE